MGSASRAPKTCARLSAEVSAVPTSWSEIRDCLLQWWKLTSALHQSVEWLQDDLMTNHGLTTTQISCNFLPNSAVEVSAMRQRAVGAATTTPATRPVIAAKRAACASNPSNSLCGMGPPRASDKKLKVRRSSICTSRSSVTTFHTASWKRRRSTRWCDGTPSLGYCTRTCGSSMFNSDVTAEPKTRQG